MPSHWLIHQPRQSHFILQYPNKYKDVHSITFQAFSFDHLVDVLLKVINEISPITQEKRKCTDILGEVMTMLFGLVNSKATDDAKGAFVSKGANQVNQKCSVGESQGTCTVTRMPPLSSNKAEPTLALKPRGDVTRSPKQGYQWPYKKD